MFKTILHNTWSNRLHETFQANLRAEADQTHIFAFSEVMHTPGGVLPFGEWCHTSPKVKEPPVHVNGHNQHRAVLGRNFSSDTAWQTHSAYSCVETSNDFEDVQYGSTLHWRNDVDEIAHGKDYVYGKRAEAFHPDKPSPSVLHWIVFRYQNELYLIANLRGVWLKHNTKGDTPERTLQSQNVLKVMERVTKQYRVHHVILGGDFNLAPDTEALRLLQDGFLGIPLVNLNKIHGKLNTRTPSFRGYCDSDTCLAADYMLIGATTGLLERITRFNVPPEPEISDHRQLILEWN